MHHFKWNYKEKVNSIKHGNMTSSAGQLLSQSKLWRLQRKEEFLSKDKGRIKKEKITTQRGRSALTIQ